jgi:hypothetical protein
MSPFSLGEKIVLAVLIGLQVAFVWLLLALARPACDCPPAATGPAAPPVRARGNLPTASGRPLPLRYDDGVRVQGAIRHAPVGASQ